MTISQSGKFIMSIKQLHIYYILVMRIVVEECRNDKTNLFCFFVEFRKDFYTIPRNNLWNRLEYLKVPFNLRAFAIRLYENVITKFKSREG